MKLFNWGSKREPVSDYPYGLNKERVASLEDLTSNKGYVTFMTLLREIAEDKGLNLLHSPEEGNFRYWQGYINCMRMIQTIIPDLVEQTRNAQRNEDVRQYTEPQRGSDKRTFLGTGPWYDAVFPGPGSDRKPDA